MTSISRPGPAWTIPGAGSVPSLGALVRGEVSGAVTGRIALVGVSLLAALLYLVDLTVSGYANVYYSAAAWAASQSWSAWFFGSIDPANFITVDKPPLSTMVMGLSVRLLGLSPASILLPEALIGVATVMLVFATVQRQFGTIAATIASVMTALTPAAVLIFRYNNPDALLVLLFVAAAFSLVRALETDRFRWLVLAGVLVGFAFNTKYLQAYLVLPAFAFTYLLAGRGSVRRRFAGLLVALGAVLVASGWWLAVVELIPASLRPFIGGSTNNSALDLVFGYDGLGRIFGGSAGNGGGNGASFSGTPGVLRLFNAIMGGQISWLLPFSAIALGAGLLLRIRARRTDAARAGYVMWGLWLAVNGLVFSFMSGTIHSYYVVAMAPAVGALVGAGAVDLWRLRCRLRFGGLPLAAAIALSSIWSWALLDRTPEFAPGLGAAILGLGFAAALVVAMPSELTLPGAIERLRLPLIASALGLVVLVAGPASYAVDTIVSAHSGGDPSAGPTVAGDRGFGGPDGGFGGGFGGQFPGGPGQGGPFAGVTASTSSTSSTAATASAPGAAGSTSTPTATVASTGESSGESSGTATMALAAVTGSASSGSTANAPAFGGGDDASADSALVSYLLANRGTATWIVAVRSANTAGSIELAAGQSVMAMGGFTGSDPAPTLAQLKQLVAQGKIRFVLVTGNGMGGGPGGPNSTTGEVESWVASVGKVVDYGGNSGTLYDLSGVTSSAS